MTYRRDLRLRLGNRSDRIALKIVQKLIDIVKLRQRYRAVFHQVSNCNCRIVNEVVFLARAGGRRDEFLRLESADVRREILRALQVSDRG